MAKATLVGVTPEGELVIRASGIKMMNQVLSIAKAAAAMGNGKEMQEAGTKAAEGIVTILKELPAEEESE